jgi:hypothetical protein
MGRSVRARISGRRSDCGMGNFDSVNAGIVSVAVVLSPVMAVLL